MNEILIFLLSLAGAFVLRVCGFGFGVFTMAWLPYLLPLLRRGDNAIGHSGYGRIHPRGFQKLEEDRLA